MKQKYYNLAILTLGIFDLILLGWLLSPHVDLAVLDPQGLVASKERDLILSALGLMLFVAVPIFVLTFFFVWKYRAGQKAKYKPNWDKSVSLQAVWWILPALVVLMLAIITWKTSHELDPHKSITSNNPPITIQVVALNWKWLFIYPDQNIATVNFVEFPANTPINFVLTSDAPMNSFWIPQLGGQMYAMAGMSTQLNLMANSIGEYSGSAAEINGPGFAGMIFVAKSTSRNDFDTWITIQSQNPNTLNLNEYDKLAKDSENNPQAFYSLAEKDLFNKVISKYTTPTK